MEADQGVVVDSVSQKELPGDAGVLCGDHIGAMKDLQSPKSDVMEIPNGSSDNVQRAVGQQALLG
jgi:hypothetical protein